MAIVTVELRNLLQTNFQLFDFSYQCTDPAWKVELEKAIVDHFYFEEIGQETPERFKHVFRTTMQAIMPYYDKLHELSKINIDMSSLNNYKMTEKMTKTNDRALINSGSDVNSSDISTDSRNTDYPQHTNIVDDIPSGRSVSDTDSTNTITFGSKQDEERNEEYEKTIEGYEGVSPMELLKQYQDSLIRINSEIIQELKSCFILVY